VIEQLLEQSSHASAASLLSEDCVDAERIAAWVDGVLKREDAAAVERHVSACSRCQTLLATFARAEPAVVADAARHRSGFGWHLRWLVPMATAATVLAVWIALPTDEQPENVARPSATPQDQLEPAKPSELPKAPAAETPATALPAPRSTPAREDSKKIAETVARGRRADKDEAAFRTLDKLGKSKVESAPAKPAQEGTAVTSNQAAAGARQMAAESVQVRAREDRSDTLRKNLVAIEITSPDPAYRWRIADAVRIERTVDGGSRWTPVSLVAADASAAPDVLIAGHAPSQNVAWLVGRGGAVYVTTDGARFERVPFVERLDLVSVVAIDGRQATVTASDGRTFRTSDRGVTWTPVR
jgi:hypothetical protein